jgi:hypothetical protein
MNEPSHRVVLHGAPQFCTSLQAMLRGEEWDVRYRAWRSAADVAVITQNLHGCDLIYVRGGLMRQGKFLRLARLMGVDRMVMVWIGTDALVATRNAARGNGHSHVDAWIAKQTHWAVSPWVAEEVRALGLACTHVTDSFIPAPDNLAPLPREFSVLVFLPNAKPDTLWLYGWDHVLEIARRFPEMRFTLVGLSENQGVDAPSNIRNAGYLSNLAPVFKDSTVLLRLPRHDGLSWMVQEALAQGRHVIYSYPFAGCIQAANSDEAASELRRLLDLHNSGSLSPNRAGAEFISRLYNPEAVRAGVWLRWKEILREKPSR